MTFEETKEKIWEVAKVLRSEKKRAEIRTEQDTKHYLILPFIEALGYNPSNLDEVKYEYAAGHYGTRVERVDIAIFLPQQSDPVMIIECKSIKDDLQLKSDPDAGKYDAKLLQLASYFQNLHFTNIGVLTNGQKYLFFSDTVQPKVEMDTSPFFEFDLLEFDRSESPPEAIKNLEDFTKEKFNNLNIDKVATKLKALLEIKEAFREECCRPSQLFVKAVQSRIPDNRCPDAAYNEWEQYVKEGFHQYINEQAAEFHKRGPSEESASEN